MAYPSDHNMQWTLGQFTSEGTTLAGPTAPFYVGLLTEVDETGGPGTEVTGGSYQRQEATFALNSSLLSNTIEVVFTEASGTVVGWALYDANGNHWWSGYLYDSNGFTTEFPLSPGFRVAFPVGSQVVGVDHA